MTAGQLNTRSTVHFFRHLTGLTGGHLKVWHYYSHAKHSARYQPQITFSPDTVWDEGNPWFSEHIAHRPLVARRDGDVLFVGGMDWEHLPHDVREDSTIRKISLVQDLRHDDREDPRYASLRYKAIRICVSTEVRDSIAATGCVNGPTIVIPNAVDETVVRACAVGHKSIDVLIAGQKNPDLARELANCIHAQFTSAVNETCLSLNGELQVRVLVARVPRPEFLRLMAGSHAAVFLPKQREGFYLPALEAMALDTTVVCPDVVGNRSFCLPNYNCFRPAYASDAICAAAISAITMVESERSRLHANALHTVEQHSLAREREEFLKILNRVDELW